MAHPLLGPDLWELRATGSSSMLWKPEESRRRPEQLGLGPGPGVIQALAE